MEGAYNFYLTAKENFPADIVEANLLPVFLNASGLDSSIVSSFTLSKIGSNNFSTNLASRENPDVQTEHVEVNELLMTLEVTMNVKDLGFSNGRAWADEVGAAVSAELGIEVLVTEIAAVSEGHGCSS